MTPMPDRSFAHRLGRLRALLRRYPAVTPLMLTGFALLLGAIMIYSGAGPAPGLEREPPVMIGGPFRLIGPDGAPVTDKSFPGKWTLVFFGYTFCPDVCPTTLIDIASAMAALGPRAGAVQPLFITVDPARDTPTVLKEYMAHFGGGTIGLTGSLAAIADVERAYRVYAAARPNENGGSPFFDHSAIIYLMNPAGQYATNFVAGTPGNEIAAGILKMLDGKS